MTKTETEKQKKVIAAIKAGYHVTGQINPALQPDWYMAINNDRGYPMFNNGDEVKLDGSQKIFYWEGTSIDDYPI